MKSPPTLRVFVQLDDTCTCVTKFAFFPNRVILHPLFYRLIDLYNFPHIDYFRRYCCACTAERQTVSNTLVPVFNINTFALPPRRLLCHRKLRVGHPCHCSSPPSSLVCKAPKTFVPNTATYYIKGSWCEKNHARTNGMDGGGVNGIKAGTQLGVPDRVGSSRPLAFSGCGTH